MAQTIAIHYRNDFKTLVRLPEYYRNEPFSFRYSSGRGFRGYYASFDGSSFKNCKLLDDGKTVLVLFDNHRLAPGWLDVLRVIAGKKKFIETNILLSTCSDETRDPREAIEEQRRN